MNRKHISYSDVDLAHWRDYGEILTDSLWLFPQRDKTGGHALTLRGNFIPQVIQQLLWRYTKLDDVCADLFIGSGTTAMECLRLGRRCVGLDIDKEKIEDLQVNHSKKLLRRLMFYHADSTTEHGMSCALQGLEVFGSDYAQLVVLHPPYWDILQFTQHARDLSNCRSLDEFLAKMCRVACISWDILEPGRFAGLVIGDKYENQQLVPLGFYTMNVMLDVGFRLKSIVVKDIQGNEQGKGKDANLWRYRALAGGFVVFKHEYVFVFQKPKHRG